MSAESVCFVKRTLVVADDLIRLKLFFPERPACFHTSWTELERSLTLPPWVVQNIRSDLT